MLTHFDRERLIWGSYISPDEKILLLALNQFLDAETKDLTSPVQASINFAVLGGVA